MKTILAIIGLCLTILFIGAAFGIGDIKFYYGGKELTFKSGNYK